MTTLLLLLFAYLLGALPIGLLVGRMARGIDIREFGSGNTGATNVWRTLGPFWGIVVFALDVGKGWLPVLAARQAAFHPSPVLGAGPQNAAVPGVLPWLPVLGGLAAILGHNFSPFLRFKGGKGVATSLGVAIGLSWQAGLLGFATWGVLLLLTRYVSVSSILGTAVGAFFIWWLNGKQLPYGLFGLLATVFVLLKHRPNLARLRAGTEPMVGRGLNKGDSNKDDSNKDAATPPAPPKVPSS